MSKETRQDNDDRSPNGVLLASAIGGVAIAETLAETGADGLDVVLGGAIGAVAINAVLNALRPNRQ